MAYFLNPRFFWSLSWLTVLGTIMMGYQNCGNYSFHDKSSSPQFSLSALQGMNSQFISFNNVNPSTTIQINGNQLIPAEVIFRNSGQLTWPENTHRIKPIFPEPQSAQYYRIDRLPGPTNAVPHGLDMSYPFVLGINGDSNIPNGSCVDVSVRFQMWCDEISSTFGDFSVPLTARLCNSPTECAANQYPTEAECLNHFQSCTQITCSTTPCPECWSGVGSCPVDTYYDHNANPVCQPCGDGFIPGPNGGCISCADQDRIEDSPGHCSDTTCPLNQIPVNNQCQTCPIDQFEFTPGHCSPCTANSSCTYNANSVLPPGTYLVPTPVNPITGVCGCLELHSCMNTNPVSQICTNQNLDECCAPCGPTPGPTSPPTGLACTSPTPRTTPEPGCQTFDFQCHCQNDFAYDPSTQTCLHCENGLYPNPNPNPNTQPRCLPCVDSIETQPGVCDIHCDSGYVPVDNQCQPCPTDQWEDPADPGYCKTCGPGFIAIANQCVACIDQREAINSTTLNHFCQNCGPGFIQNSTDPTAECVSCGDFKEVQASPPAPVGQTTCGEKCPKHFIPAINFEDPHSGPGGLWKDICKQCTVGEQAEYQDGICSTCKTKQELTDQHYCPTSEPMSAYTDVLCTAVPAEDWNGCPEKCDPQLINCHCPADFKQVDATHACIECGPGQVPFDLNADGIKEACVSCTDIPGFEDFIEGVPGSCNQKCPVGQIPDIATNTCRSCLANEFETAPNGQPGSGHCTACPIDGQVYKDGICQFCGENKEYDTSSPGYCKTCSPDFANDGTHKMCESCALNSVPQDTNGNGTPDHCVTCPANQHEDDTTHMCVNNCPATPRPPTSIPLDTKCHVITAADTCQEWVCDVACAAGSKPKDTNSDGIPEECEACANNTAELEENPGQCTSCGDDSAALTNTACTKCGVGFTSQVVSTTIGEDGATYETYACVACEFGYEPVDGQCGAVACDASSAQHCRLENNSVSPNFKRGCSCVSSWNCDWHCDAACEQEGTNSCTSASIATWSFVNMTGVTAAPTPWPTPANDSCTGGVCPTPTPTPECDIWENQEQFCQEDCGAHRKNMPSCNTSDCQGHPGAECTDAAGCQDRCGRECFNENGNHCP